MSDFFQFRQHSIKFKQQKVGIIETFCHWFTVTREAFKMANSMNETWVARLLIVIARITDQNEPQSFINEYVRERDDSQDLSDISYK